MISNSFTFAEFHKKHHKLIYKRTTEKHSQYCFMCIRRFCEFDNNGDRPLNDIRAADIHFYGDDLIQEHGLTERTANRHMVAVGKVIRYAFTNHYVQYPISVDQYDEDNARPRYFTDEEIDRILTWLKTNNEAPYVYYMSMLALHTGMRLGEILKLANDTATVEVDEDGDTWIYLPETKWNGRGKKPRYVLLNKYAKAAVESLEYLWDHYDTKRFYSVWGEMRYRVFGSDDKSVLFHIWRHTYATRLANDLSVNQTVIAKQMGHSDLKTTNKYIKLKSSTQRDIAKQVERQYEGALNARHS